MQTTFTDTSYLNKNVFQIGDIVLYCWRPGYSRWRKGKIVSNNFAMLNLPDFFGKPEYYISELDENDNVINTQKSVAIDKDSKYLVKFKPGMEWCIGENSNVVPYIKDSENELEVTEITINTLNDESEEDEKYKELNKKLDTIIEKLDLLLISPVRYPAYPDYPWTTTPQPIQVPQPFTPWYEHSPKINCDITKSETKENIYTGHLNWKENYPYEKYVSTYSDTKFDEFCKKYNDMSCKGNYKD